MGRWQVHIVHMRARDIKVGDVIAKDPSKFDGWFRVHEIRQLGDGTFNLLDKANVRSFAAGPFDLVGLQTPIPLPAEAERNVRREEASHAHSSGVHVAVAAAQGVPEAGGTEISPDAPGAASPPEPSTPAARREAAAREAMAGGEPGGGARALPGA